MFSYEPSTISCFEVGVLASMPGWAAHSGQQGRRARRQVNVGAGLVESVVQDRSDLGVDIAHPVRL